ncbi:MAG TPA: hydantoinase B/oxoprolinase family protein, partial [Hellea balneolensis]|nr:hydantoinase B/oxoprolinase family protein [Hellea balneolensis]
GISIHYRFLEKGTISIHDDRWFIYPWGVNGGEPGMRSKKILKRKNGKTKVLPSKCDDIVVNEGDVLIYDTWGGGGWGNPLERDAELVALEVKRGLVTRKGAKRYGVVIAKDGSVDKKATEELRRKMAPGICKEIFNYGPDLKTLRKNCKKETGLKAPRQPVWEAAE